jgi:PadR family transcriptional regulator
MNCGTATGGRVSKAKLDLLHGTLDLMVLRTLDVLGPLHGYGIARRIEQVSGNEVLLNQGTIYASLVRLDLSGVGNFGQPSQSQVLFHYKTGPQTTGKGCSPLGAALGRDEPRARFADGRR